MKFVAEKAPLLAALQRCARVAERRSEAVILTHVRIDALKKGVRLTACDMQREISIDVEAMVDKPGATTAGVRAMLGFAGGAPDGSQVEIVQAKPNERLALRAGRARALLPTLPIADFPTFAQAEFHAAVELEGEAFALALASVAHAQSNDPARIYLNGTYLHRRAARELVCVAVDGHRLARTVLEPASDLPEIPGVIVPSAAVADIHGLASKFEKLELGVSETMVRVLAGDVVFTSRLVDGTFPDYERVIPPADVETGFDIDRAAFAAAARRCDILSEAKEHTIKLAPGKGALQLASADRVDGGEVADELDASTTTKTAIGIDPRYLLAALDALDGSSVRVRYADASSPIVFTDPSQPHKLQLVMTKRV